MDSSTWEAGDDVNLGSVLWRGTLSDLEDTEVQCDQENLSMGSLGISYECMHLCLTMYTVTWEH